MTKEEKELIRNHVRKEVETLEKSVITLTELLNSGDQSDTNDWFSPDESDSSKEVNEMALAKAMQRIVMLRDILNRIDNPGYGVCTKCNNPIPFERMKAVPSATRCITCQ